MPRNRSRSPYAETVGSSQSQETRRQSLSPRSVARLWGPQEVPIHLAYTQSQEGTQPSHGAVPANCSPPTESSIPAGQASRQLSQESTQAAVFAPDLAPGAETPFPVTQALDSNESSEDIGGDTQARLAELYIEGMEALQADLNDKFMKMMGGMQNMQTSQETNFAAVKGSLATLETRQAATETTLTEVQSEQKRIRLAHEKLAQDVQHMQSGGGNRTASSAASTAAEGGAGGAATKRMRESDFRPANLSIVNLCPFVAVRTEGLTLEEAKAHWTNVVQLLDADMHTLAGSGTLTVDFPRNIRYKVSGFDGNCSSVIAAIRKYRRDHVATSWDIYAEASPFKAERSKVWAAMRRIAKSEFEEVREEGFPEYSIKVKLPVDMVDVDDVDDAPGDGFIKFVSMNKYTLRLTFGVEALAFLQWDEGHANECVQVFL